MDAQARRAGAGRMPRRCSRRAFVSRCATRAALAGLLTAPLSDVRARQAVRLATVNCLGPRIANKAEEIMGSIPQYVYIGPYEDILLAG
jgi:hypothetical protein